MHAVTDPDNSREERLDRLIRRYGKELLRLCCVYLKDASLAEDAVQETFLKAYRRMDTFRGQSSEKTWLFAIAVNVCRDMRRSAWFRCVDRSIDADRLEAQIRQPELSLMQEIMGLPRKYMEVLLLYYYADMMQSEMAQLLHISVPAVSKRLAKARQMLKEALEGGGACE